MSHKDFVKQWTPQEYQGDKTKQYKILEQYIQELFGERTKENSLLQQINEKEILLSSVQRAIHVCNTHPERTVSLAIPNTNIFMTYTSGESLDFFKHDEGNLVRDIGILKTQLKFCCEHQIELEKKIHGRKIWTEYLSSNGQKLQH